MKATGTTTLNQTRYHNAVNEIDGNGGNSIASSGGTPDWANPAYDLAGNMTTMPKPSDPTTGFTLKYDAWNRLVEVKEVANVVQQNSYDGLGRRIVRSVYSSGTPSYKIHYYYNDQWQLVEERKEVGGTVDSDPLATYYWHPYYVDALAMRFYDADTDDVYGENNDGTHYYCQDANFNVTAVVNASGTVLERYNYTPYGEMTVLNADFSPDSSGGDGVSDIGNNHLYTGRERDPETGLQLNRHRYYASHLGRWTTRDPIGYGGGMNLYGYVDGQPMFYLDPSGLRKPPGFWEQYFYYSEWGNSAPADPAWMNWGGEVGDVAALAGGAGAIARKCLLKAAEKPLKRKVIREIIEVEVDIDDIFRPPFERPPQFPPWQRPPSTQPPGGWWPPPGTGSG